MQRRAALAGLAAGLAGFAGCIGARTFRRAEDPWRDVSTDGSGGASTFTGQAVLPRGTYAAQAVEIGSRAILRLNGSVESGDPIDFLTMTRSEFENWADESDYVYVKNASAMASAEMSLATPIEAGEYVHVVDNTYGGEADAGESRTVSLELTVATPN